MPKPFSYSTPEVHKGTPNRLREHEEIGRCAGEVAQDCQEADALEVPHKIDAFQAHDRHASRGADDERGTSCSCAIGQELPENAIFHEHGVPGIHDLVRLNHVVHAHAGGDKGHVVHDGAQQANRQVNQIHVVQAHAKPIGRQHQVPCFLQGPHGQQNPQEKQHRRRVNVPQHPHHREVFLVLLVFGPVKQFRQNPEQPQAHHHAHEGRQMRHGLEHGNKQQARHPRGKHQVPFKRRGGIPLIVLLGLRTLNVTIQSEAQHRQRHHHAYDARHNQMRHNDARSQLPANPQHGGCDVTNRRPRSPGIGRDDHHPCEQPAGGSVRDQLAQQRDHHDGRCQIVQQGRKEKRQDADNPEHFDLVRRSNSVCDHAESFVGIHEFHNGHGSHEEKQDGADFLHVMQQPVFEEHRQSSMAFSAKRTVGLHQVGGNVVGAQDKQRPTQGSCHQS